MLYQFKVCITYCLGNSIHSSVFTWSVNICHHNVFMANMVLIGYIPYNVIFISVSYLFHIGSLILLNPLYLLYPFPLHLPPPLWQPPDCSLFRHQSVSFFFVCLLDSTYKGNPMVFVLPCLTYFT